MFKVLPLYLHYTQSGINNGDSIHYRVTDYGAIGDGVTDDSTAINDTLTALNTAGSGVLIFTTDKTYYINSNITIPKNAYVWFEPNAIIKVDNSKTLTLNSKFDAGPYQIFSTGGKFTFSGNKLPGESCFAQWFGIVADGNGVTSGTDNYRGLINMVHFLYENDGLKVTFPTGIMCYTNQSWMSGLRNVHFDFIDCKLQHIGPQPIDGTIYFNTNTFQFIEQTPDFIDTVDKNSFNIKLKNTSLINNYSTGDWIMIAGYEQQGGGFPINYRYFEFKQISGTNSNGNITLKKPLKNNYKEDWFTLWPDNIGPASVTLLDRRSNSYRFTENMIVENLTILPSINGFNTTIGNIDLDQTSLFSVVGCKNFIGRNIKANVLVVQKGENYTFENCEFIYAEPDKQLNNLNIKNCHFSLLIQGVGVDNIDIRNTTITHQLGLSPRTLYVENCDLFGLGGNFDFGGIGIPGEWNATSHYYKDNRFYFPENSYVPLVVGTSFNPPALGPKYITVLSGSGNSVIYISGSGNDLIHRENMGKGTTLLSTGGYSLTVTDITHDSGGYRFIIDYKSRFIPKSGENLYYYIMERLYCDGNTKVYGNNLVPQTFNYKPANIYVNTNDNFSEKNLEVTWNDFTLYPNNNNQIIHGYPTEITINVTKPYTGAGSARLVLEYNYPNYQSYVSTIDTSVIGTRTCTNLTTVGEVGNDSLSPLGFGYKENFLISVMDVDNSGLSGFAGSLTFKANNR